MQLQLSFGSESVCFWFFFFVVLSFGIQFGSGRRAVLNLISEVSSD